MNLKDRCKSILNKFGKRNIIIVLSVVIVIAVLICTVISIKNHYDKQQEAIQAQIHLEEARAEEVRQESEKARKEQEEKDRLEQEYVTCIDNYNNAVEEYNNKVDTINGFIEKIEQYDLIEQTSALTSKDVREKDFDTFWNNGADLSVISDETETIVTDTKNLEEEYYKICQLACNSAVKEYNVLANEYNDLLSRTSVDFINDIDKKARLKDEITYEQILTCTEEMVLQVISIITNGTNELTEEYIIADQITAPDKDWVMERLGNAKSVKVRQAVTETNDPNGLLGKANGYTSCIYFGLQQIDSTKIKGTNIVSKGTDAGGAVEVYPTLEAALNRCEYLSQFDNTLLYSGSYVIVGTMVVRTSYKLSNQQQIDITNEIITAFTEIEQ